MLTTNKKIYRERIYVNSYIQQIQQNPDQFNDSAFTVNINQQYDNVVGVSLDMATLKCLLPSFYRSANQIDFRDLSFFANGTTYELQCLQYFQDLSSLQSWLNAQTPVQFVITLNDSYTYTIQMQTSTPVILIGYGWTKLGFLLDGTDALLFTGTYPYDLSFSSTINIQMQPLKTFANGFGSLNFSILSNTSFGGAVQYLAQSTSENPNYLQCDPFTLPQAFQINLLNCDMQPLETVQSRGQSNKTGLEVILVFTLYIER